MIDIHVLTHSGTRQDWLDQCLASLEGQPCTVHVVEGYTGHIGAGRAKGYALGEHGFVGFVDPDDYLLPGALDACLVGLQTADAVVTKEWVEYEDGSRHPHPKSWHHVAVYKRELVTPLLAHIETLPAFGDLMMREYLKPKQLDAIGYVWRVHDGGVHSQYNQAQYETLRAECPWP